MKILYVSEYFYPYVHGGAEAAILETAKALILKGHHVFVLTPNYGTKPYEEIEGVKINRYEFPVKLKKYNGQLSPSVLSNPYSWWVLFVEIIKFCRLEKMDVLHTHSIGFLPPFVIAAKILKIPTVITFRDAQLLCNYGYCLTKERFARSCNLCDYFFSDFRNFWRNKVPDKNITSFFQQLSYAIIGRIRTNFLKRVSNFVSAKITLSDSQKKTFEENGILITKRIYNYAKYPKKLLHKMPENYILYASGKLSAGKGADLLFESFAIISKKYSKLRLLVVTDGSIEKYINMTKRLGIFNKVVFKALPDYKKVSNFRNISLVEVVPSVYPESFGRSALALVEGLPSVVTNRGGSPEIIEDRRYGYVVEPNVDDLVYGLEQAIKNNKTLRNNIAKDINLLRNKFEIGPISEHVKLYKNLK